MARPTPTGGTGDDNDTQSDADDPRQAIREVKKAQREARQDGDTDGTTEDVTGSVSGGDVLGPTAGTIEEDLTDPVDDPDTSGTTGGTVSAPTGSGSGGVMGPTGGTIEEELTEPTQEQPQPDEAEQPDQEDTKRDLREVKRRRRAAAAAARRREGTPARTERPEPRREPVREARPTEGVEADEGAVADQARQLEQRAIQEIEGVSSPEHVAVVRDGDQLRAVLTRSGVEQRLVQGAIAQSPVVDEPSDVRVVERDGQLTVELTQSGQADIREQQTTLMGQDIGTGLATATGALPAGVSEDVATDLEQQLEQQIAQQRAQQAGVTNPRFRQGVTGGVDLERGEDFVIAGTAEGFEARLTPEFQRELATRRLESQLESRAGVDLEPGADFQVQRTEEGFTAELTDSGQQKIQQATTADRGFVEGVAARTREELSPLAQAAVPSELRSQALAGEREIMRRGRRGNLAARTFVGGEALTQVGTDVQAAVAEGLTAEDVEERGPKVGFTVGEDRNIERATIGEQLGQVAGVTAASPLFLAGGVAQVAGATGLTVEDIAAGRPSPVDVEAGTTATKQTVGTFGTLAARRPVEAAGLLATPVVAGRARPGRTSGARSGRASIGTRQEFAQGVREAGLKPAEARGRAQAARARVREELGRAREFVGEERGQRALLEEPVRERGGQETTTNLGQMQPRAQGPTMRSGGVDVRTGTRPGRTGIEGQRGFAERVREQKRLEQAPEPELPPRVEIPAEAGTGGVGVTVPGPTLTVTEEGPPGVEEDTEPPRTAEERLTQALAKRGVDQPEQRAQAILQEPGEGTLVEGTGQEGPRTLTEQVEQATKEKERVVERAQEARPAEPTGERVTVRGRERERTRERTRETTALVEPEQQVPGLTERTTTGERVSEPTGRSRIPVTPTPTTPGTPTPRTPGPPPTPLGLPRLGVGPRTRARGRGVAGEPAAREDPLTIGFGAETFSVFATGQATAPTQAELAAQPFAQRATGELPTAELLTAAGQRDVERVPALVGTGEPLVDVGGGDAETGVDLSLGLDLDLEAGDQ